MKHEKTFEAINKLKEVEIELHRLKNALEMSNRALETKDEPVGWIDNKGNMICTKINESCKPLYTTSPQRPWVGLTDEDFQPAVQKAMMYYGYEPKHSTLTSGAGFYGLVRSIEAKLKDKNS